MPPRTLGAKEPTYAIYSRLAHVPAAQELLCGRLEQELRVGPLRVNREAVLRTSTALRSLRVLHSDSNAFQMQRRPYRDYQAHAISRVRPPARPGRGGLWRSPRAAGGRRPGGASPASGL